MRSKKKPMTKTIKSGFRIMIALLRNAKIEFRIWKDRLDWKYPKLGKIQQR